MSAAEVNIARHKLTVSDYHRMAECGILAPDARVELIDGEIIDMAPQGSAHASIIAALHERIAGLVQPQGQMRCKLPIVLGERSEPEPDLAVVKSRPDYYRAAHPTTSDVFLLIEVADRTLAYDRDIKRRLYSDHRIPALWIVDVAARQVHCFSRPSADGYGQCMVIAASGPAMLPPPFVVKVSLADLL